MTGWLVRDGLYELFSQANRGHFGRMGRVVMGQTKKPGPDLRQALPRTVPGYDDLPSTLVITLR